MSGNFSETYAPPADQLAALEEALTKALGAQKAPPSGFVAGVEVGVYREVSMSGGKPTVVEAYKPLSGNTAYAQTPLAPGMVRVGNTVTSVEAVRRMPGVPADWQPGQPIPGFEEPAEGKAGNPAGQPDATRGNGTEQTGQGAEDEPGVTPAMRESVAEAGRLLDHAAEVVGNEVVTQYLTEFARTGEIPEGGLPEGITPELVDKVQQGFVAQCNASLHEVGASVAMLERMLDDSDLGLARMAAIHMNADIVKQLGQKAQHRLAMLPQSDPTAFEERIAELSPEERAVLHKSKTTGQWVVRVPGQPEMSWGLAVRRGIVRF